MRLSFSKEVRASPRRLWALLAAPTRWSEWASHLVATGALASGRLEAGVRGRVQVARTISVPVEITAVEPPRAWSWRVRLPLGPTVLHQLRPRGRGRTVVEIVFECAPPLVPLVRLLYAPLVRSALARLAALAEEEQRSGA